MYRILDILTFEDLTTLPTNWLRDLEDVMASQFPTNIFPNVSNANLPEPVLYADIDGDAGNNILMGTSGDDVINGFAGNDEIDGAGGDDVIIGGADADVLTGGAGADIFDSEGDFSVNTLSEFNGDLITDFTADDVIGFHSAFAFNSNFVFTSDGMGGGSLDLGGGNSLLFDNIAAGAEFITVDDRIVGSEIHLYDPAGLDFIISEDRFEFVASIGIAALTINAGVDVGNDPTGMFGTATGNIDLNDGIDHTVTNNGTSQSILLETITAQINNNAMILDPNGVGIGLSTTALTTPTNAVINNASGATISAAAAFSLSGGNRLDPLSTGIDNVTINNDGLIESTFGIAQGSVQDTMILNNTGAIRTVAGNFNASQGVGAGGETTEINNFGVLEVLSALGGFVGTEAVALYFSGPRNASDYTVINSGRISSTGEAIRMGSVSDNNTVFEISITNTATGIIESDTNMNLGEAAIEGSSNFIIFNTPGETTELLTRFTIVNEGQISGDISLYISDYFLVNGAIGFTQNNGITVSVLSIPGTDGVIQDLNLDGTPINDVNGNPVFTPGTINSTSLGDVNYEVTDGVPTLTDTNGDPILLLPDTDDLAAGSFNDTVTNSGTITGDVFLGVGNDIFVSEMSGTVSGVIDGGLGNDRFTGADLGNSFFGGEGSDTFFSFSGGDSLDGGNGFDTADYRGSTSAVRFNADTGGTLGDALGDSFNSIERYFLTDFNDIVTGSNANEFFYGEAGNDQINGGGGIDRIYGGTGDDVQRGQDGNDTLYGSAGSDQLNGGAGFDIANYSNAASSVIVNLGGTGVGGDAAGDSYFGIEAVYGSDFNDALNGNASSNELRGGDGNDTLNGNGGNDRLFGGQGADILDGGAGTDIAVYTAASSAVSVNLGGLGTAGEADGDFYDSIEWVWGSAFDDSITGDAANNRLEGRDGHDTLDGEGGNDRLQGGNGNDTINGGDGVDTIFGQDGDDIMFGGAGNDFFFGGAGVDSHDGGAGIDTVSYLASGPIAIENGVGVGGDAAGDTYTDIERYFGSSGNDVINASGVLQGNGGNDYLQGMNGSNDSLNGGAGTDTFAYDATGGAADVIQGFFLGEQISILGGDTDFDTEAEILAAGTNAGANVVFDFGGGNTLTLVGVSLEDLPTNTFTFDGPLFGEPLDDPDAFAANVEQVFDMDALI